MYHKQHTRLRLRSLPQLRVLSIRAAVKDIRHGAAATSRAHIRSPTLPAAKCKYARSPELRVRGLSITALQDDSSRTSGVLFFHDAPPAPCVFLLFRPSPCRRANERHSFRRWRSTSRFRKRCLLTRHSTSLVRWSASYNSSSRPGSCGGMHKELRRNPRRRVIGSLRGRA